MIAQSLPICDNGQFCVPLLHCRCATCMGVPYAPVPPLCLFDPDRHCRWPFVSQFNTETPRTLCTCYFHGSISWPIAVAQLPSLALLDPSQISRIRTDMAVGFATHVPPSMRPWENVISCTAPISPSQLRRVVTCDRSVREVTLT